MMADIEGKRIDTIMVTELSRLSRSVTDFLNFVKELEDHDCDFICPQYDFDTTSPAGKVFMTIIMALAQFERELTAERVKSHFHARALRGLSNGGVPILGYDKESEHPGHLVINESEAKIVREIFDLYLQSDGVAKVVNSLNPHSALKKCKFLQLDSCDFNTLAPFLWRLPRSLRHPFFRKGGDLSLKGSPSFNPPTTLISLLLC